MRCTQVDRLTDFLHSQTEHNGLFALHFGISNGLPTGDRYSVGAQADSAYEYLLKQWLMTGKTEGRFLDMCKSSIVAKYPSGCNIFGDLLTYGMVFHRITDLRSADAIIENILYLSPTRQLLYATDIFRPSLQPVHDFQHLSCFLSGVFALGVATIPNLDPRHAWAAEGLAHTCWITYADTATGLGPESVRFMQSDGKRWVDELAAWEEQGRPDSVPPGVNQASPVIPGEDTEYTVVDARYLLRPEVSVPAVSRTHLLKFTYHRLSRVST